MRRAVAYLRCNDSSTEKLASQRKCITTWAAQEKITVIGWHIDCASGTVPLRLRPGLRQALAELTTRQADILVVARPCRLSRSLLQMARILRRLRKLQVEVHSAEDGAVSMSLFEHALPLLRAASHRQS